MADITCVYSCLCCLSNHIGAKFAINIDNCPSAYKTMMPSTKNCTSLHEYEQSLSVKYKCVTFLHTGISMTHIPSSARLYFTK